jgi:hypothetical protein
MYSEIEAFFKAYKVEESEIVEAEIRIGVSFREDLRKFYKEVGYGFVNNEIRAIDRLIAPLGCADIRLREDIYEYDPDLEIYESIEEESLIFFEINEGVYTSIGLQDGKIYMIDKVVAESLLDFLKNIAKPEYFDI